MFCSGALHIFHFLTAMAEIVGTVASVWTLFKLCIDSFDFLDTIQQYDTDLCMLAVKLQIQKYRLRVWGEKMGLSPKSVGGNRFLLRSNHLPPLIKNVLQLVLNLLDQSENTRRKYGCERIEDIGERAARLEYESLSVVDQINAVFQNFDKSGPRRYIPSVFTRRACWAIRDKAKFANLISEAKGFIDDLQQLTEEVVTSAQLERIIEECVRRMNHVPALFTVSEVCKTDYPSISEAASSRASIVRSSSPGALEESVRDWMRRIEDAK
jgi:hypothetical protein